MIFQTVALNKTVWYHRGMDAKDLDALRTKEYWDTRYAQEPEGQQFDWFKKYEDLSPWLDELLRVDDKILILGCGNSVRTRKTFYELKTE